MATLSRDLLPLLVSSAAAVYLVAGEAWYRRYRRKDPDGRFFSRAHFPSWYGLLLLWMAHGSPTLVSLMFLYLVVDAPGVCRVAEEGIELGAFSLLRPRRLVPWNEIAGLGSGGPRNILLARGGPPFPFGDFRSVVSSRARVTRLYLENDEETDRFLDAVREHRGEILYGRTVDGL